MLGALAVLFYVERVAFMDASYQLFMVLYQGDFAIQSGRFGAISTQVFPLLATKLGASLKMVMLSYSLSFIAFPLILYLWLSRWFRIQIMPLCLALFYLLLVSHTFYWIQSELIQACALNLFFWGIVLERKVISKGIYILLILVLSAIVFTHPLAFIPFLFCLSFSFFSGVNKKVLFLSLCSVVLLLIVKYGFLPIQSYDAVSLTNSKNLIHFYKFFSFISTRRFFKYCLTDYYLFPIILTCISWFYYEKRNWSKLSLVWLFVLGYLVLVHSSYPWGPPQFHMESFYQILSIFVLLPFCYDFIPNLSPRHNRAFLLLVTLLLSIRIAHIGLQHQPYTKRLHWMQALLDQTEQISGTKFAIAEADVPIELIKNGWASPFETLLLSTLENPDSSRSVFIYNKDIDITSKLSKKRYLLTPFSDLPYESLPSTYFNLQDTGAYQVLDLQLIPPLTH
ncbi:MAG: hypothetical protein F6K19_20505 [Cyanothece sp. SIO1E1]|nr:hypothetical protein [Cyanothece sp. SIO1E1]